VPLPRWWTFLYQVSDQPRYSNPPGGNHFM